MNKDSRDQASLLLSIKIMFRVKRILFGGTGTATCGEFEEMVKKGVLISADVAFGASSKEKRVGF